MRHLRQFIAGIAIGVALGGWTFAGWMRAIILNRSMPTEGESIFLWSDLMDDALLPFLVLVPLTLLAVAVLIIFLPERKR